MHRLLKLRLLGTARLLLLLRMISSSKYRERDDRLLLQQILEMLFSSLDSR